MQKSQNNNIESKEHLQRNKQVIFYSKRVKLGKTKHSFGEGNGTPLQYSCLENPMDGGAWWYAVHGVARVGHD